MSRVPLAPPFEARVGPSHSTRLLSNGTYVALVTAAGTGASRLGDVALTPWQLDAVEATGGLRFHVRDRESGDLWCASAPSHAGGTEDRTGSLWRPGRILLTRSHDEIESRLEIAVLPRAPVEVRRLSFTNTSHRHRYLDVTSYAEIALNDDRAHAAHPVFSKLFLQTALDRTRRTIVVTRRPRGHDETHPCLIHALVEPVPIEWETDRSRFIGRGTHMPAALSPLGRLSGTLGSVLDPIASLRTPVALAPGDRATLTFVLGASTDRPLLDATLDRLATPGGIDAAFREAEAHADVVIASAGISHTEAAYLEALAGAALHRAPSLRRPVDARTRGTVDDVVALGIDPGRPTCLLHAGDPAGVALWPALMDAADYWRALGLAFDVRVVTDDEQLTTETLQRGARVLSPHAAGPSAAALAEAAAGVVLTDAWPKLTPDYPWMVSSVEAPRTREDCPPQGSDPHDGGGGFDADGRAFVIRVSRDPEGNLSLPPRPWINVIANESFGCLVSETGAGYTWSGNSRQHRLTPWHNDPVTDPHGEALYVRDEESGAYWSPTPGPAPGPGTYEVRHGWGHSVYTYAHGDLEEETLVFVPRHDTVKITRLRVRNRGTRARRLSLVAYHRLVLGHTPEDSGPTVLTDYDADERVLLARNVFEQDGGGGVTFAAFTTTAPTVEHVETDRRRFIGCGRSPRAPAALESTALDDEIDPRGDPCFAIQALLVIAPGGQAEVGMLFGTATDRAGALECVAGYRRAGAIDTALETVRTFWIEGTSRIHVSTPSTALDTMINGWLAYQTVSCRLWGRSALYQSGGAFGFRDQLQDATAIVHLWPDLTRAQIILSAARQFTEGDVLHWWHPPHDRGIRTRFVDDRLWLPYVTAHYVRTTGDRTILDEMVPFISARRLRPGEDEALLVPEVAPDAGNLYEHCCRAIDCSLSTGSHGLPLFGTGDWNDGMNRVGRKGRGESVWMAFFLVFVLDRIIPFCASRDDRDRVRRYSEHRSSLTAAANDAGWDGAWYRRGFYDDGDPLGSHASDECRIDALVQAWAVISGVAPRERASRAMDAVVEHLMDEEAGLVRLLTPPFEHTSKDPGYIRGYVPGVRENGGQYTHAAMWVVRAMAEIGRRNDAGRILEMINPITRTRTAADIARYQVEPYVVAADVYGEPPHVGRGGWTWYTGSSGWMLRVALESILGVSVSEGRTLSIAPRIPDHWSGFRLEYTVPGTRTCYDISADSSGPTSAAVTSAALDGVPVPLEGGVAKVPILGDDRRHRVSLTLAAMTPDPPAVAPPAAPTGGDG